MTLYWIFLFFLFISLDLYYSTDINNNDALFYMYELGEEYWWRWPDPGTDCSQNGYLGHEHAELSGMGAPLNPDAGLFLTWHFSMFSSLFNRFKRSSRRTMDPKKAAFFIIPYDLALDGYLEKHTCRNVKKCTYGFIPKLQKQLSASPYWQRHQGADHVVLWSLGQYHPWPSNGCDLFMSDFCGECTITSYWMDSTKPNSRFVSLPFPAAYHWWDGIKNIPWSLLNANKRNITAVYLGSTQTLNPVHTKIRRAMAAQCDSRKDCHWRKISHDSKDNNIGNAIDVYKQAVFCLCPPGDDPARKAVFDAILSGCIPVIFHGTTLYNQYPWHIGEEAARDISVSVPGAQVRSGKLNFMDVLRGIPPEVIRLKQARLAEIAPRVQYAMPPLVHLVNRSDSTPWDPPFKDAAEISLDGFAERIRRVLRNESTGIPPPHMLVKTWHQQYDQVIVQVPTVMPNISDKPYLLQRLDSSLLCIPPKTKTLSNMKNNLHSSAFDEVSQHTARPAKNSWINFANLSALHNRTHLNNESLFYMYDLDEEFWWRWPDPGTDCSQNGYLGHEHAELSGMGAPLNPDAGLFLTWHFSMFSSLFNRFKRSSRRTMDPKKAAFFIIPYDLGLDGYLKKHDCSNSRRCTWGLPQKLQKQLSASPYWQRHQGADHVVLWSLGQYHPWPHNGCDIFMKNFCSRCTFTCYWMDSTKPESRFISMPFPASYHWLDGIKTLPWTVTDPSQRNLTAVYLGSTQTLNPAHTKIRRAMAAQCNASSECHWRKIAHTSTDSSIGSFLDVYKQAIFCLCPPGDDPARKAVFDAILSGCIPVIFEKATLYNQYPWHIGEEAARDISVSVPGAQVRSGKLNFMDVLRGIPPEVIRLKQARLAEIAPRVQYAMPPLMHLVNRSDSTPWDPPFKDAAEISLDGFAERIRRVLRNESTGIPPPHMLVKTWHQQYDQIIVQVPGNTRNVTTSGAGPSGDSPSLSRRKHGKEGHGIGHHKHHQN